MPCERTAKNMSAVAQESWRDLADFPDGWGSSLSCATSRAYRRLAFGWTANPSDRNSTSFADRQSGERHRRFRRRHRNEPRDKALAVNPRRWSSTTNFRARTSSPCPARPRGRGRSRSSQELFAQSNTAQGQFEPWQTPTLLRLFDDFLKPAPGKLGITSGDDFRERLL
jgi:hypothetical protein